MNSCKHCGFTGEPEDFRKPKGKVCNECYKKQKRKGDEKYRKKNRERINKDERDYRKKNRERINKKKRNNYKKNHKVFIKRERIRRRKNGMLPWSQVKHLRLGLYIEQAIARMFGSVAEVTNNPGVDFICPNGYKMQVKTSSLSKSKYPSWYFNINENKIVDYFILVAVNHIDDIDKENFKHVHIWIMKGNVLNYKTGVSISPSRVYKWNEYSIMKEYENKFINCCNVIKKIRIDNYERI